MNSTINGSGVNVTNFLSDNIKHTLFTMIALSLGNILGIVVGTTGNCLVVLVVIFNREMRSPTNLFIASLSVADFLVTSICMPIFFVYNVIAWPLWPFGDTTCKLASYFVHVSVMASALSLLCISYDRFLFVYFPMKRIMNIKLAKIIVALIWLVSPLLLLPSLFHHELIETALGGKIVSMCREKWDTKKQLHIYQLYRVSCYFLFMAQITVVYFAIGRRLRKRRLPGFQSVQNKNKLLLQKRKVTKMLFLVVLCFGLSWLPYIVNKLLIIFPPSKNFKAPNVFVFVGNFLGLLNSCINPILYAVLNHNFSKAFKNALRCRWNYEVEERRRRVSEPQIFQECPTTPCPDQQRERRLSSVSSLQNYNIDFLNSLKSPSPELIGFVYFRKLDGMNCSDVVQSYKTPNKHVKRRVSFSNIADVTHAMSKSETARKVRSLENITEKPRDEENVDRMKCHIVPFCGEPQDDDTVFHTQGC